MGKRPNILFINTDQHRADSLSIAGHPALVTPSFDEIGARGARFTNAFTTCASCVAARRSFMTGLHPAHGGVVGYREGVPIDGPTLPSILADEGYETTLVGRTMHQSPREEPYGFDTRILGSTYIRDDEYASFLDWQAPGMGGVRGLGLSNNGWTVKPWTLPEYLHPTYWASRRATEVIDDMDGINPHFLTLSFYAPHPPLCPPTNYLERYLDADLPSPWIGEWATPPAEPAFGFGVDSNHVNLPPQVLKRTRAGYYGLINQIDDAIYPVIAAFKQASRKAGRPWIICHTSDHGEMLGDHYYFRKAEPYQGSAAIPLLLQASPELDCESGIAPSGVVCLEDIMPTFLELAGIPVPPDIDGRSLVPVLRGEAASVRDYLHSEHSACYDENQAYHMLTDGKTKYIFRPHDGREELFDLEEDPGECRNVATSSTGVCAQWRLRMVEELSGRPEGFVQDGQLVPGRPYEAVIRR